MIGQQRYSLLSIILDDLFRQNKLSLLLLLLVLLSSLAIIFVTHNTRLLTEQREQLILEKDKLDIDWRHLILEENVLGDHSRISLLASQKLHMQYVQVGQEKIIVQK